MRASGVLLTLVLALAACEHKEGRGGAEGTHTARKDEEGHKVEGAKPEEPVAEETRGASALGSESIASGAGADEGVGGGKVAAGEPFDPARHGFAFVNSFSGSPLPGGLTRMVEALGIGAPTSGYGLCGGMSAAAADFYLAGMEVPGRKDVPGEGDALFNYFTQRQGDSIGPGIAGAMKFSEWMGLPARGENGFRARTGRELAVLRAKLEERGVQPIGLIYRRAGEGGVWDNHQVLAYDVVEVGPGRVDVMLYDPNTPGDGTNRLEMTEVRSDDAGGYRTVQRFARGARERPVHGWFVVGYEPRLPSPGL